jgi:hypothetical protein
MCSLHLPTKEEKQVPTFSVVDKEKDVNADDPS